MTAWLKRTGNAMTWNRVGVVSAAVCLAGICVTFVAAQAETDSPETADPLSATDLPIGSNCTVQVVRGQFQESQTGMIRKVTEKWIVLGDKTERRTQAGTPIPNKIPYISSHFRNAGAQTQISKREIWIPRESILYLTIEKAPVAVTPERGGSGEVEASK